MIGYKEVPKPVLSGSMKVTAEWEVLKRMTFGTQTSVVPFVQIQPMMLQRSKDKVTSVKHLKLFSKIERGTLFRSQMKDETWQTTP